MKIVTPVIIDPLLAEWAGTKAAIEAELAREAAAKTRATATRAHNRAADLRTAFLERLKNFRVLDPACGSGNFLYIALRALKDIEHRANLNAEALGLGRSFPQVGPEAVRGIELNPYAAELARVSVWIGEIQWMRLNGFDAGRNPILRPLDTIECRDAILNEDGTRADWPDADVVIGNPPFLGDKKMIAELGEDYTANLRTTWKGTVPGGADLVTYWFAKSWDMIEADRLKRAGLVSTNSIRGGANREVLKPIVEKGRIFEAWSDEPWIVEGAAVRVSIVCFDSIIAAASNLDGNQVAQIFTDLSAEVNVVGSARLSSNANRSFIGDQKSGQFDLDGPTAREFLQLPTNPNGRQNSDVIRPWINGMDVTRRSSDRWIIDFGPYMALSDAALFEAPFEAVVRDVKPSREGLRRANHRERWWIHGEARPGMRHATSQLSRYLVTPRVAKHRFFVWAASQFLPDSRLVVIAREDDVSFGLLSSRLHQIWTFATCSWHGVGNDPTYNAQSCFETFPFPEGLTPDIPAADYADDPRAIAIAEAAADLNAKREAWLNPPDLVRREPEVVPGYPDRLLPVDDAAAAILKKRTLTNLYNARPAWLDHAHAALDAAVAAAYGWGDDFRAGTLTDDEILARLFALNQKRAKPGV